MKIITIKQSSLLDSPTTGAKLLDIPPGAILEALARTTNGATAWVKLDYRGYVGWFLEDNTDPYETKNKSNIVYLADIQTEDKNDPEQFVLWENTAGKEITCKNQCGQICCCAILGKALSEVLPVWRDHGDSSYDYAYNGGEDHGTGHEQLANLLACYGVDSTPLNEYFGDAHTAYRYGEALKKNLIIYGVSINQSSGELVTNKQIAHWILLESVTVDGNDGVFHHFNPFGNWKKDVSWDFLKLSAQAFSDGGFSGLVVPISELTEASGIF